MRRLTIDLTKYHLCDVDDCLEYDNYIIVAWIAGKIEFKFACLEHKKQIEEDDW